MTFPWNYINERQRETVDRLTQSGEERGIVWWKIGEGKTRIALCWAAKLLKDEPPPCRVLIVCSPDAIRQWKDEAVLCPWIDSSCLDFLSYGMLTSESTQWLINRMLIEKKIKAVIVDELWLFKNVKAKRTQAISRLTHMLPALGLSGSMVTARNIEDIYGQAFAVGLNNVIAKSLTDFRTQYCISFKSFGGLAYTARKGALEQILQKLAPYVDAYFPPPAREAKFLAQTVDPTPQQKTLIESLTNDYFAELDSGELEIKNSAVLINKIQQVSDGIIIDGQGNHSLVQSSKFDRTLDLCNDLFNAGERVIIWCAFKASLDQIVKALGKEATSLSSHTTFDFAGWKRGNYKACVATVGSGASLNDFANVQYAIIYSVPFNYRALQQALGRTDRKTSTHSIAYYYLMQTADTMDKEIYSALKITQYVEETVISASTQVVANFMKNKGFIGKKK